MATVTGNNTSETLNGGNNADVITGNFGNDSITAGGGNDLVNAGAASTATIERVSWAGAGANNANLASGYTQNTGTTNVTLTHSNTATGGEVSVETDQAIYVAQGESFATNSALYLGRAGGTGQTTLGLSFAPTTGTAGSSTLADVSNVSFRINDIDTAGWQDRITILAYDSAGNAVPVTITLGAGSTDTVDGSTITAGAGSESPNASAASALITIPGPVQRIELLYSNLGTASQRIDLSDVYFTADHVDNDTVSGGAGRDSVYGGGGNDILSGDAGNDTVGGGEGNDILYGGADSDSVTGDAGNDLIYGDTTSTLAGGAGDTISGGAGNDTAYGGAGGDSILGEAGTDLIYGGDGVDSLYGGADSDTLYGEAGAESLFGGDGGDSLFGGADADTLNGDAGDDTLSGDAGADSLLGGTGDDSLDGGSENDYLDGGSENDRLTGGAGVDTIFGGTGDDYVLLTTTDVIDGGTGSDTLDATTGTTAEVVTFSSGTGGTVDNGSTFTAIETFVSGAGADRYDAQNATIAVTIFTGADADTVTGGAGADTIYGGSGADSLAGGAGNDAIYGGDDADRILIAASGGTDLVDGGAAGTDTDTLDMTALTTAVTATLTGEAGTATYTGGTVNFTEIERLFTGSGADSISAAAATSGVWVDTGLGNDTVTGSGLADTLATGDGADRISAGGGADAVDAGAGDDVVAAGAGNDTVTGGTGDDSVQGEDGADSLTGGEGADTLDGGIGDDRLIGEAGADSLLGGDGTDYLDGGSEDDVLSGGAGLDTVLGGTGNDRIIGSASDAIDGGTGTDTLDGSGDALAEVVTFTSGTGGTVDNGSSFTGIEAFASDAGADRYDAANATIALTISTGADNDTVIGGAANDTVYGGAGADSLSGGAGLDSLFGGTGADTLAGGAGNDSLDGGDDADRFLVAALGGTDQVTGGEGGTDLDTLDMSALATAVTATLTGEAGAASTQGGTVNFTQIERLVTGSGNDTVTAGNASVGVWVDTGAGADVVTGSGLADTVYGGDGADSLTGGAGADSLFGGAGNDTLIGGADNDALDGGDDADRFVIAALGGTDQVTGGEGGTDLDTLDMSALTTAVTATLTGEAGTASTSGGTVNFTQVERVYTGSGADTISAATATQGVWVDAGAGDNRITGSGLADTITAAGGADSILAGGGADVIDAGGGADTVDGGAGADVLTGGDGADQLSGGADADTIQGGAGNDLISGDGGDDLLDGGTGNDTFLLQAGSGLDTIIGGEDSSGSDQDASGADIDRLSDSSAAAVQVVFTGDEAGTLLRPDGSGASFSQIEAISTGGGADLLDARASGVGQSLASGGGDDTVLGGAGADVIDASSGNDLVNGGGGADLISGGLGSDTFLGGVGDTIDGGAGDNDLLDLSEWGWARTQVTYTTGDPQSGTVQFLDANGLVVGSMAFSNIEKVMPCFTPGTRIATARGPIVVEDLVEGDLVLTRDNGMQPLRWIGQRRLSLADLIVQPRLKPLRLAARSLGQGLPLNDLIVSPQHRMLIEGARAEMLFGEPEVLVAARHLPMAEEILPAGVTYIHLLFDAHEIIKAEGAWTESFQPAARMLSEMETETRAEIEALFPELVHGGFPAARISLKAHEAKVLLEV